MSSDGKTVTVASIPENWSRNLPSDHSMACFLRDSKTTVEIDVFISKIVVSAVEMYVNLFIVDSIHNQQFTAGRLRR